MRQIVLQHDGRLAVFSTVVDDFVVRDATVDEVADKAADFARETASPKATPEQNAARIQRARETARRNATYVLAGEPHKAYRHPRSWQDIEAFLACFDHPDSPHPHKSHDPDDEENDGDEQPEPELNPKETGERENSLLYRLGPRIDTLPKSS
ncbi:hypothetical protein [Streptomyces cinereoruber]